MQPFLCDKAYELTFEKEFQDGTEDMKEIER